MFVSPLLDILRQFLIAYTPVGVRLTSCYDYHNWFLSRGNTHTAGEYENGYTKFNFHDLNMLVCKDTDLLEIMK